MRVYSSPDLKKWTLENENALNTETRPYGIYFRPKVLYNKNTAKYLLWVNHLPNDTTPLAAYGKAGYTVASSDSPKGPFEVVTEAAALSEGSAGDADIFVDASGENAYIAYNGWYNNHKISVEKLNNDFTDSLGAQYNSGYISPAKMEAPQVFYREGWYYLLYGHTCCFCKEGAGAHVQYAKDPLGPWTDSEVELNPQINRQGYHKIAGQNSYVFRIKQADETYGYVFANDLWSTAADNLKSHDRQYWHQLEFDDSVATEKVAPAIKELEW